MVKNIVILGAGFAGLSAAGHLSKHLKDPAYSIILVDRSPNTIFSPDLYEVATAYHEEITECCLTRLNATVATPIKAVIDSKKVNFVNDEITGIDTEEHKIYLKKANAISYEFLLAALGSQPNFFNIPGLERHAFTMKTARDAIKINCHIDHFIQTLWKARNMREVNIVVGGGGATGIETAAELVGFLCKTAKKYQFPREKIQVHLVEGGNKLAGLNPKGTKIISRRLTRLGVQLHMESYITRATSKFVELKKAGVASPSTASSPFSKALPASAKPTAPSAASATSPSGADPQTATPAPTSKLKSDVLIWTGGVGVNSIISSALGSPNHRGAIPVNEFLEASTSPHIFAAGDNSYKEDSAHHPVPMLAQAAEKEGALAAKNILALIAHQPLAPYHPPKSWPLILPLGGKKALLYIKGFYFFGLIPWYLRRLIALRHNLQLLPFFQAIKKWLGGNKIFTDND